MVKHEHTCQICFDSEGEDPALGLRFATKICCDECPAVVCETCYGAYLLSSMEVAFPGALPRIRCPICLVPLVKARWAGFIGMCEETQWMIATYENLCSLSCSFRTPCCENASYTHLPSVPYEQESANQPWSYVALFNDEVDVEDVQKDKIKAQLHDTLDKFCHHQLPARDLVNFLDINFNPDERKQMLNNVTGAMIDDERRAALLLAYHYVNRKVYTHCCNYPVCFNCKRRRHNDNPCPCEKEDEEEVRDTDMIECRQCHVPLVRVEGCNDVSCICGFRMRWDTEVDIAQRNRRGIIPVDVFDRTLYDQWKHWHEMFHEEIELPLRQLQLKILTTIMVKKRIPFAHYMQRWLYKHCLARLLTQRRIEIILMSKNAKSSALLESLGSQVWKNRCTERLRQQCPSIERLRRFTWQSRFSYHVLRPDELWRTSTQLFLQTEQKRSSALVDAFRRYVWSFRCTRVIESPPDLGLERMNMLRSISEKPLLIFVQRTIRKMWHHHFTLTCLEEMKIVRISRIQSLMSQDTKDVIRNGLQRGFWRIRFKCQILPAIRSYLLFNSSKMDGMPDELHELKESIASMMAIEIE